MRILHIIRSSRREYGGPISALLSIARHNAKNGHHYTIASMDAPGDLELNEASPSIEFIGFGPSKGVYGFNRNLEGWLMKNFDRFDAIVVNGIWSHHSKVAHRVLAPRKKPYYVFCHGFLDSYFKKNALAKHLKKQLYWLFVEYRVIRDAKYVFFTSEEEKVRSVDSFWPFSANTMVVNYGSEPPPKEEISQRTGFLEKFSELKGQKFFLFLSRIHPKKGCDLLIKAFARLLIHKPEYFLVMGGPVEDKYKSELVELANSLGVSSKVLWTGMLGGTLKWGAFRSADAFVLPSHQENFGVVVSESLSCGLPVLISDQVALHHEVKKYGAGLVFPDTEDGTFELLKSWAELPSDRGSKMRDDSLRCYEDCFEISKAAENLIKLFLGDSV